MKNLQLEKISHHTVYFLPRDQNTRQKIGLNLTIKEYRLCLGSDLFKTPVKSPNNALKNPGTVLGWGISPRCSAPNRQTLNVLLEFFFERDQSREGTKPANIM